MNDALYSAAEIRAIEAAYAKKTPGDALMLRAGAAVASFAVSIVKKKRGANILVLAGPGNNGGDAWVAAARLKASGHKLTVLEPKAQKNADPSARAAMAAYKTARGNITTKFSDEASYDLIIDGLFGIGLQRPPDGVFAETIARVNANADSNNTPILAIDVPSGLSSDTGVALGATISADFTITFLGAKPGLYTADGTDVAGEIHVDTLGVAAAESCGALLRRESIAPLIPERRKNSHKGSFGNVGIIGGAPGMTGAAIIAARAALHMGPGKVFLGLVTKDAPGFDPINPEIMLRTADELLTDTSITALAIGMGLGTDKTAPRLLSAALCGTMPMLLDADALTLICENPSIHAALQAKTAGKPQQAMSLVFTPHPGEAARLLGVQTVEIQSDRVKAAKLIAAKFNVLAVLKGAGTVIATPEGRYWINTSGNPGMASGGMGDALSGMIAAFMAQGMTSLDAARLGVFLHGAAADDCVTHGMAPHGLTASEVIFEARTLLNAGIQSPHYESA